MGFSAWSPSHTLLIVITLLAFCGQLIAILTYLKTLAKQHSVEIKQLAERIERQGETFFQRMDKQAADLRQQGETFLHALERLEMRTDKRIDEVNQQISEVRTEMNQQIGAVREEMNQRLSGMQAEMSKLNQNYIDHLTHHKS